MTVRRMLPLAAAVLVLAVSAGRAAVEPAPVSTRSGVFTAEQAAQGAEIYTARCAMCHGPSLVGTWEVPTLKGRFMAHWGRARLSGLYDYLAHAMPQFAPGTLEAEDNARLLAFILRENGEPAGAKALPSDRAALTGIVIEPVPANLAR